MIIKWINKVSKEEGYVKKLNKKGQYFENTFEAAEAKKFSKKTIDEAIKTVSEYCADNDYVVVE